MPYRELSMIDVKEVLRRWSACAAHHACSIDWMHPTAGELGLDRAPVPEVRGDAVARREQLERACAVSFGKSPSR